MSTSIFSNLSWGSGPNMKVSASYNYRRSGADMQYQITVSIAPVTGSSYFGYSIQWYTNVNGAGYVSQGTLKNASPSQWSSAITATTGWITVSNKTSGSTSFALKVTSSGSTGSGRAAGEYKGYTLYVSPAASTMTVTSGTYIGSNWSFSISKSDSGFKHKIAWYCGSDSGYVLGSDSSYPTESSATWAPPASRFGPILRDTTSKTITYKLWTYDSNNNYIGEKSYDYTLYVPSYTPTASNFTVSIYNDNTIVNSWGVALQRYSKYNYSFTPSYNYSAQAKSYSISNMAGASASGSGTWSSGAISNRTGVVNSYGAFTPKLQYTDSRGKKCASTSPSPSSIYVYEYFKPQLKNVIASRCTTTGELSDVGTNIKIACNPVYATVTVNDEPKNSVTTIYTVKRVSDEAVLVDGEELDDIGVIIPTNDQEFEIELDESYIVTLTTTDALSNSVTVASPVKVATTTLHLKAGGKGVGIGRYCNEDNKLQVGWDTDISGNIYFEGGEQTGERKIYFKNENGEHPHNCQLYGGNPDSVTGIGLWDVQNNRRVLQYLDNSNVLYLGNYGSNIYIGAQKLFMQSALQIINDMSLLNNKPAGSTDWGRCIKIGSDGDRDKYYLYIDSQNHLFVGAALNGASTINWVEK